VKRGTVLIISAVVLAMFLLASALFFAQGGFGRGHGRFDSILGLLALPWIFLPWPEALWPRGDFLPVVLIPFLMNCTVLVVVVLAFRWPAKSATGV
jgi:hypothetical protein